MFSHFPILSAEQRMTPYYDDVTSMISKLGPAAPSAYFNGHGARLHDSIRDPFHA